MKIATAENTIERGENVLPGNEFGIIFNEKMARILSKQIYGNVIAAPVRELSCNAWDSHRAAGTLDTPFDVHLPSNMEPYFEVRDYGVGMSPDTVMNTYRMYGGTTKDTSNLDIGGLGIGCKSPLAYTNTFDMTSYFGGMAYSYVIYKNQRGVPDITLMGSQPSSEPTGVRVRVPVQSRDFDSFRENAQRVFRWFSHHPQVIGNSRYERQSPPTAILKGTSWSLFESNYYDRGSAFVIMGNVRYPIQADNLPERYRNVLEWPLRLDAQIGELDVAASREELNYDEVTVEVLQRLLDRVLSEAQSTLEAKISACATLWDARVVLHKIARDYGTRRVLGDLNRLGYTPTWQGKAIDEYDRASWYKLFEGGKDDPTPPVSEINGKRRAESVSSMMFENTVIVLDDASRASARCRQRWGLTNTRVYLVSGALIGDKILPANKCPQVKRLLEHLGNPPIVLASSLPKPDARPAMKFKGQKFNIGSYRRWGRGRKSDQWDTAEELTTDRGGLFVTMDHLDPVTLHGHSLSLERMSNLAIGLGLLARDTPVWGLNKTNTRLVADNAKWQRFEIWLRKEFEGYLARHNLGDHSSAVDQLSNLPYSFNASADAWHDVFGSQSNTLGEFCRTWHSLRTCTDSSKIDMHAVRELAQMLGVNLSALNKSDPDALARQAVKAFKAYPLLKHAVRSYNKDEILEFVDYVKLVDASNI